MSHDGWLLLLFVWLIVWLVVGVVGVVALGRLLAAA